MTAGREQDAREGLRALADLWDAQQADYPDHEAGAAAAAAVRLCARELRAALLPSPPATTGAEEVREAADAAVKAWAISARWGQDQNWDGVRHAMGALATALAASPPPATDGDAAAERIKALHCDPHWCFDDDGKGDYVFGTGPGLKPLPCPTLKALASPSPVGDTETETR